MRRLCKDCAKTVRRHSEDSPKNLRRLSKERRLSKDFFVYLLGLLFLRLLVASKISAAEAGGDAALIVLETVKVSSLISGSPALALCFAFISFRTSIPPSDVSRTFHKSKSTFFIGKCGAAPEQKRVTMAINLMAKSSSPSTGVSTKEKNKYHFTLGD